MRKLPEPSLKPQRNLWFPLVFSPSVRLEIVEVVNMNSLEHLDVLRKRNKDLLSRLKQRGEELMRLHGCSPRERMETEDGEEEERRDPAEMMTGSDRQDGQCAREDLAKPVARFAGNQTAFTKHYRRLTRHAVCHDSGALIQVQLRSLIT